VLVYARKLSSFLFLILGQGLRSNHAWIIL